MISNIYTQLADLPAAIKGFVRLNEDESYTIILNSRLSYQSNADTYKHELEHIQHGDYANFSADKTEQKAHNY